MHLSCIYITPFVILRCKTSLEGAYTPVGRAPSVFARSAALPSLFLQPAMSRECVLVHDSHIGLMVT